MTSSGDWNSSRRNDNVPQKKALSGYTYREYVRGRDAITVQIGSGSTPLRFVEEIYEENVKTGPSPNITFVTNNRAVESLFMDQQLSGGTNLKHLQLSSIGGTLHPFLNATCGEIAAHMIQDAVLCPDIVVMGAYGVRFSAGTINLFYWFDTELTVQAALATRPTGHRIVLIDECDCSPGA